jgi:uncharacterized protein
MRKILVLIFFVTCFVPAIGFSGEGRWEEPWGAGSQPSSGDAGARRSATSGQWIAEGGLHIFQKYISPVDGDRCPSYPTCSQYALEAVRKHGAVMGALMAFDRLIHEADEIRRAPLVRIGERGRYFDPVENNDFWWR